MYKRQETELERQTEGQREKGADLQRSRLWQTREKECDPDRERKADKCRKTERYTEAETQTERQT